MWTRQIGRQRHRSVFCLRVLATFLLLTFCKTEFYLVPWVVQGSEETHKFFMKIGGFEKADTVEACHMACFLQYSHCHSFLYNEQQKQCVPGFLLSETTRSAEWYPGFLLYSSKIRSDSWCGIEKLNRDAAKMARQQNAAFFAISGRTNSCVAFFQNKDPYLKAYERCENLQGKMWWNRYPKETPFPEQVLRDVGKTIFYTGVQRRPLSHYGRWSWFDHVNLTAKEAENLTGSKFGCSYTRYLNHLSITPVACDAKPEGDKASYFCLLENQLLATRLIPT